MIRNLLHQIRNFFYYGWHFRNQRDWDSGFLLEMMHLKMRDISKCLDNSKIWDFPKKQSRRLKIAIHILERLKEDNYFNNACELYKKRCGKWDFR